MFADMFKNLDKLQEFHYKFNLGYYDELDYLSKNI